MKLPTDKEMMDWLTSAQCIIECFYYKSWRVLASVYPHDDGRGRLLGTGTSPRQAIADAMRREAKSKKKYEAMIDQQERERLRRVTRLP